MKILGNALFVLFIISTTVQAHSGWNRHVVTSDIGERIIEVHAPENPQGSTTYPVLYLLDGESNADFTQAVSAFISENGRSPELITVAIRSGDTRASDLLPSDSVQNGQADRFLQFLRKTLIPYVDERYPTAPLRLISGHSYGAVFALYALGNAPELFSAYFLQSPYLDKTIGAPVLEGLAAKLPSIDGPVFVCAVLGTEPDFAPGVGALRAILANNENVTWFSQEFPRQSHMTTRLLGYYSGLDHYFGDRWEISTTALKENKDRAVENHVRQLTETFGYRVVYSETQYAHAVQSLLSMGELSAAGRVAHQFSKAYPEAPLPHVLRAQAFAMSRDLRSARTELRWAQKLLDRDPTNEDWQPIRSAVEQISNAIR